MCLTTGVAGPRGAAPQHPQVRVRCPQHAAHPVTTRESTAIGTQLLHWLPGTMSVCSSPLMVVAAFNDRGCMRPGVVQTFHRDRRQRSGWCCGQLITLRRQHCVCSTAEPEWASAQSVMGTRCCPTVDATQYGDLGCNSTQRFRPFSSRFKSESVSKACTVVLRSPTHGLQEAHHARLRSAMATIDLAARRTLL